MINESEVNVFSFEHLEQLLATVVQLHTDLVQTVTVVKQLSSF